jgi:glycosyltransferase involved in cell wall biosynthesis
VGDIADYWFACSDKAALRLYGERYVNYPRYYDIPNAINAKKYRYDKEIAAKIRREIGVSNDTLLCGHVGTFSQPKNHSFLLDVFKEVLKKNPNARLVCCGAGALMPQVKEKAKNFGIMDKIIFSGVVMNVNEFMMAMDVFIFPSIFEGFPISVIEAEATGLPIVMSAVITKEVDMTDLVNRRTLDEPAQKWADTVCNIGHKERTIYNQTIVDSKYNMETSVRMISSLYVQMINQK